ncbi:uncharacterized protein JN550_005893 [Neoarthrinium moseri]|uniref:uncharacterized protein n=1 Tax=Neoarthrinium moseri TaxID=1658444 RepID=UPI001FDE59A0|nr:uncharacterized protein JN550_005893 [Neoarthrinium moseri]KAI1869263.1 hypothetical protein JN550_005893 [Neoarthrinium moseri]
MAGSSAHQAHIQRMMEGATAGLYAYQSPYSRLDGHEQTGWGDEIDLGEVDDSHSSLPSLRPSMDESDYRNPALSSIPVPLIPGAGACRESKFKEIFRSVSTSLGRNNVSSSPRGRRRPSEAANPESTVDVDELAQKYGYVPRECHARHDVSIEAWDWLYICQIIMSILATVGSAVALFLAIHRKQWGQVISPSSEARMSHATSQSVFNGLYKLVEVMFAAVFVTFIGQILTRRAFAKNSKAINVAEVTMRNWVNQPGSLLTQYQGLPYAGLNMLGALTILATIGALLYSTACTALISPKPMWGQWNYDVNIHGYAWASWANIYYIKSTCPAIGSAFGDDYEYPWACLQIKFNGDSYRNLMAFLETWQNGTKATAVLSDRPPARAIIYGNTTLTSTWLDVYEPAEIVDGRLINNVTLAMPHAGVSSLYSEKTSALTRLFQPTRNEDFGGYQVQAAVVSPVINVMCVNTFKKELEPLVDDSRKIEQTTDATSLDELFQWGKKYSRYRPAFTKLPMAHNLVTDRQWKIEGADATYLMAKSTSTSNYTLWEMGVSCRHPDAPWEANNPDFAIQYYDPTRNMTPTMKSPDWRNLTVEWSKSMGLNGGAQDNNASHARLLTDLILNKPELPPNMPSLAEALAVYASSVLVTGSIGASFGHNWYTGDYETKVARDPVLEVFEARWRTRQFISSYEAENADQGYESRPSALAVFYYIVLAVVLLANLVCLGYLVKHRGLVADFTEPQNLFTLAINSPPSRVLQGACGQGPEYRDLGTAFRVAYAPASNHYFFEDARDAPMRKAAKRLSRLSMATGGDQSYLHVVDGAYADSYKRLSSHKPLL